MLWIPDQMTFLHDQIIGRERAVIFSPEKRIDIIVTDFYLTAGGRIGKLFIDAPDFADEKPIFSRGPLIEIADGFSVGLCPKRIFDDFKVPLVYKLRPEYRISFIRN